MLRKRSKKTIFLLVAKNSNRYEANSTIEKRYLEYNENVERQGWFCFVM